MFDQQLHQELSNQKPFPDQSQLPVSDMRAFPTSSPDQMLLKDASCFKTRQRSSTSTSSSDEADGDQEPSNDYGYNHKITSAAMKALGSDGIKLAEQFNNGAVPLVAYTDDATPIKPVSASSPNSSVPNSMKRKKNVADMDEDERLLASDASKKLTSRQRRQLRNRVSARHFRLRRKEYINHLEGLVVNMTTKINKMNSASTESQQNSKILALIGAQYPAILRQAQVQVQITPQMVQEPIQHQQHQHIQPPQPQPQTSHQQPRLQPQSSQPLQAKPHQPQNEFKTNNFDSNSVPVSAAAMEFYIKTESNITPTTAPTPNANIVYPAPQQPFLSEFISSNNADLSSFSSFQSSNAGHEMLVWNNAQEQDAHKTSQELQQEINIMDSIRMKPSIVNLLPSLSSKPISPPSSVSSVASAAAQNSYRAAKNTTFDPSLLSFNFQWNEDFDPNRVSPSAAAFSTDFAPHLPAGYIQLPNQRIYRSVVPDLETQLENMEIVQKSVKKESPSEVELKKDEEKEGSKQNTNTEKQVDDPNKSSDTSSSDGTSADSASMDSENSETTKNPDSTYSVSNSEEPDQNEAAFNKLSMVTADAIFKRLDLQMALVQI